MALPGQPDVAAAAAAPPAGVGGGQGEADGWARLTNLQAQLDALTGGMDTMQVHLRNLAAAQNPQGADHLQQVQAQMAELSGQVINLQRNSGQDPRRRN